MPADVIPLSRPDISQEEIRLATEVLRSGRLAMGPMTERFEEAVAARAGCDHGVAVSSGTAGLHLLMKALGIGPGDEVITTPFSFVASSNPILFVGATPVFVDIDPISLNADPKAIEAAITPRTKAIVGVEVFGNPVHMEAYASIAARHEITLIEDCCEALGTTWRSRPAGSFGRAGVFGFYPNKQITTGEGGMIVTDDGALARRCRSLANQGRAETADVPVGTGPGEVTRLGSWLLHERLGYNYRLSEVAAAIGVGQMSRLDEILERRQAVAQHYIERLAGHDAITVPTVDQDTSMSWFVFVVRLVAGYTAEERDRIVQGLRNHDIGAATYFPCIHLQPFYREEHGFGPGMFPIAESVSQRTIALPFHGHLSRREIDLVVQTLELMLSREQLSRP